MAVHIRLRRMGAKKRPFYRIVAADSRRARDGRFLEVLGTYNPITVPAEIEVKEDKLTKWLNEGAVPSDTVSSLLTQIGFVEKYHKAKAGADVSEIEVRKTIKERKKKTRKIKKAALAQAEAAAADASAKEAEAKAAAEAKEADAKAAAEAKEAKAKAAKEEAPAEEKKEDTPEEKSE
ncbi:MAG: 30S ribosomal protein S16 [bacterium]|nr:30S ribosomal protein S16 [bacterium]